MARVWSRIVWTVAFAGALLWPAGAAAQTADAIPTAITASPFDLILAGQLPNPTADAFPPDRPNVLNRPLEPTVPPPPTATPLPEIFGGYPVDPTLGYAGPSGVLPRVRPDRDFVPMEDRWRIGFPAWDRADYTAE